ncbi:m-AAA protease-interacting protein 1, mitochondrial isoform X1 [Hetaerina americana]|uniref:m-AAA protease-interacting protein 1, mitochondrial isoform X1 n=2 Tax=Hetaerina americana TaxID=62018 RepID=UPI003A7F4F16
MATRLIMRKCGFFKQSLLSGNKKIRTSACSYGWNDRNYADDVEINYKQYSAAKQGNLCRCDKISFNPITSIANNIRGPKFRQPFRIFSSGDGPKPKGLPPLMNFPQIIWPSFFKSLKNWILCTTIITPYFDREFNLPDFISGSKQAVEVVSNAISKGDWEMLQEYVVEGAISEIKNSASKFSVQQRQDLMVNKEDIYFSFPYQVGVMFDDDKDKEGDKPQRRFVEITMCYHVLLGLKELRAQNISPPLNMGMTPEYQHRICICNYRFIREFTKGKEEQSDWKVNVVNHFKPTDFLDS